MDINGVYIIRFSNWGIASKVDFLWWLSYGQSFGLSEPLKLDLSIIQLSFSLMFKINIASIIGMAIAIFIYRKV